MTPTVITPPTSEPLDLDSEVAPALKLTADELAASRVFLAVTIAGARLACESYTGRKLVTQTVEIWLDDWYERGVWRCGRLLLPFPPVQSITSIKYLDSAGVEQTWSATTGYDFLIPAGETGARAEVFPRYGTSLPAIRSQPGAIKIRSVVGYTPLAAVPARIKQGMLVYITEAWARRDLATPGTILPHNPLDAMDYWEPFRIFE